MKLLFDNFSCQEIFLVLSSVTSFIYLSLIILFALNGLLLKIQKIICIIFQRVHLLPKEFIILFDCRKTEMWADLIERQPSILYLLVVLDYFSLLCTRLNLFCFAFRLTGPQMALASENHIRKSLCLQ